MNLTPAFALDERQRWTEAFASHLADRLHWLAAYAQEHRPKPALLRPYADSFITLIRQARQFPALARPCLNLILSLHPLPERWGHWTAWEEVLREGAALAGQHGWPAEQAELLAHQAQLLGSCSRHDQAADVARRAIPLAQQSGLVRPLALSGAALANALGVMGQVAAAETLLEELLAQTAVLRPTAAPSDFDAAMLSLENSQALLLRQQGRPAEAIAAVQRMVKRVQGKPHISPYQVGDAYVDQATMLWAGGDYQTAVRALQTAIHLFEQVQDTAAATFARGNLGLVYWSMARYDLAEQYMTQCATYCEEHNAQWRLINEVGNLVVVYLGQGKLAQAQQYVERHLDLARRYGHTREESRARLNRGAVLVYLGDYAAARQELEESLALVTSEGRQELIAAVQTDLSLCYAGLGDLQTAQQFAMSAHTMAEQMSFPGLTIITLRALARFGAPETRRAHLHSALSLAQRHDRPFDEAACLFSLAGLSTTRNERITCWQQATYLLESMGATTWLAGHTADAPPFLALML